MNMPVLPRDVSYWLARSDSKAKRHAINYFLPLKVRSFRKNRNPWPYCTGLAIAWSRFEIRT